MTWKTVIPASCKRVVSTLGSPADVVTKPMPCSDEVDDLWGVGTNSGHVDAERVVREVAHLADLSRT